MKISPSDFVKIDRRDLFFFDEKVYSSPKLQMDIEGVLINQNSEGILINKKKEVWITYHDAFTDFEIFSGSTIYFLTYHGKKPINASIRNEKSNLRIEYDDNSLKIKPLELLSTSILIVCFNPETLTVLSNGWYFNNHMHGFSLDIITTEAFAMRDFI